MTSAVPKNLPAVASRAEWLAARKALLAKEKEATRAHDALNTQRRELPMVLVSKDYAFEGPQGKATLADLFEGRDQLVVQHVMWAADSEDVCSSCASGLDGIPRLRQLNARNTTFAAVSRAPVSKLQALGKRMGWEFPWYSTVGSAFNDDFFAALRIKEEVEQGLGEMPGFSAFLKVGGDVYHTYSTTQRGVEMLFSEYPVLDITALGRQEDWEKPAGRAKALGMQAGGPAMVMPDELKA